MAVLQMQKIHICALKSNRKQILEELQRSGTVQVEKDGQEDEVFRRTDTQSERNHYERQAQNAESALKVLNQYAPENKGMFASLEGKKPISVEEYYAEADRRDEVMKTVDEILALNRKAAEDHAGQVRAVSAAESLKPWLALDVPMDYRGSRTAAALIGALPAQWTEEQIREAVAKEEPGLDAWTVEVLGADRDQTCVFAVCGRADADRLENALRVNGFVKPSVQTSLTPAGYAAELEQTRKDCEAAEEADAAQIKALASEREKIQFMADYFTMRAEKYGVLGELLQSNHVFFVSGYITAENGAPLKEKLEKEYNCSVELTGIPDNETAPVVLKNNAFTAPTESVVASYGLPHKGEIDPTAIMAFCYYFLFGLMLSDAGYGAIMVIGTAVVLKKFPNMSDGTKQMMKMFFFCGISTFIWGVLFGGYFGDAIPVIAETFFHKTITIPAVWFTPLDDPMKLLMFSFLFGIIHLFLGLGIKGYMELRDHKVMDFVADVLLWYMLLVGLILILLPTDIFASMAGTAIHLPSWLVTVAEIAAVIGAVGIVLFGEWRRKNPAKRLLMGAYDLYGVTSWLSDVLSYSRLLALGLATGVIAQVINTMGSMGGGGIFGAILFILVFLIGHTLNMAINLLGAYVHTNRLQFVEFFGKFYDGGGKPFRPFSAAATKYIKFKEEM